MGSRGRRHFLIASGALLASGAGATLSARTLAQQQNRLPRIGVLIPLPASRFRGTKRHTAFIEGLGSLGYVEGQTIAIEWRFADGKFDRLPVLARELVALNVDVIVTATAPAIRAAQKATTTIPIVMAISGDPVREGLVSSLVRPERNTTGVSFLAFDAPRKILEFLIASVPNLTHVGLLQNPVGPNHARNAATIAAAAHQKGLKTLVVHARVPADIEPAFVTMARAGVGAVRVMVDPLTVSQARRIAALALQYRIPSVFSVSINVDAGGLLSYGTNGAWGFRRSTYFVGRLLKGTKVADLPIDQASEFELVINLKTAKALDLTIPNGVLLQATRVIE